MRRQLVWLVLAALIGALAGAIAQFPAARAVALVEPAGVTLNGVQGTIWRGSAERISVPQAPPLAAVRWQVSPLALLTGRVAGEVRFDVAGGQGESRFAVDRSGAINITEAQFHGPANGIARHVPETMRVEGDITAHVAEARIADRRPHRVEGRARWDRAAVRQPLDVELGAVTVAVMPDGNEGHRFTVDARDGAFDVDGGGGATVDGRYDLDLRIEPTAQASSEMFELLEVFARREDGAFVIRDAGNLPW